MMNDDHFTNSRRDRDDSSAPSEEAGVSGNGYGPGNSHQDESHGPGGPRQQKRFNAGRERKQLHPPSGKNEDENISLPFDPWRMIRALSRRWTWLVGGSLLLGALAFLYGIRGDSESAFIRLIRREATNPFRAAEAGDSYRPRELSPHTFAGLMTSPEILSEVAATSSPPVTVNELGRRIKIKPEGDTDFITILMTVKGSREETIKLLNIYAEKVVDYTRKMQERESGEMNKSLQAQLDEMEKEYQKENQALAAYSKTNTYVDVTKETESLLKQLAEINAKIAGMEIDAKIQDIKSESWRKELAKYNPAAEKLQAARQQLSDMLVSKTEIHPDVVRQKAKVAELEQQAKTQNSDTNLVGLTGNPAIDSLKGDVARMEAARATRGQELTQMVAYRSNLDAQLRALPEKGIGYARLKARLDDIDATRKLLQARQREAGLYEESALGHYRIFAEATGHNIISNRKMVKAMAFAFIGACLGLLCAAGLILLTEVSDGRVKTVVDLEKVTDLPVLMTLGDLNQMSPAAKANWAFRAWTLIAGKLTYSPNQGLICGFISSNAGEGRSTWINLLVEAASQRGLKVLTVATKPSSPVVEGNPAPKSDTKFTERPRSENPFDKKPIIVPDPVHAGPGGTATRPEPTATQNPATRIERKSPTDEIEETLTNNFLAKPAEVSQQLADPNSQAVVHIPLPGWVWSLERRKQWASALDHWKDVENMVMLVELPPASLPESVLLAENLPQVIWLCDSGKADMEESRAQLETLRHARCNLVGAVLNHEPTPWRNPLTRWVRRFTVVAFIASSLVGSASAQEKTEPVKASSTAKTTPKRSKWQEKLTLGPGDVLNFSLYGETNSLRTEVPIGPDGRVSFLQANDVMAAGLTVDELRSKLDQELGKFYRAPRTIVTPVTYRSKRYFVLGQVASRGAYPLDRPTTVLEAIAAAKGIDTGMGGAGAGGSDLTDLSRAFIIRDGKKVEVDFEKLFQQGDFSQNVSLEPGDYLFFPSASTREVYVLGEVLTPGPTLISQANSAIGAIASRGGFTRKAWKDKVLVVRGSLNKPETFIVDGRDVLGGAKSDFKLQARDIIYVSSRPWSKVEELLDVAAMSFIQGAVTAWVGVNVGPIIRKPFLPDL